jgi:hypothetical protein
MDRVEFDYWKPRDVARLLSLVEAERRYFQEMTALLPVGVALVSPSLDLMTSRAFRRDGHQRETPPTASWTSAGLPSLGGAFLAC